MSAIHPLALVEGSLQEGVSVDAFARVHAGASIGAGSSIGSHASLGPAVRLGKGCRIGPGARLDGAAELEDGVEVAANVTFVQPNGAGAALPPHRLREGAVLGAGATIMPGVQIGRFARIEPGTVVTKDVPPFAIVAGNPAMIVGYTADPDIVAQDLLDPDLAQLKPGHPLEVGVGDCRLWPLPRFGDLRGDIVPIEFTRDLPFVPLRHFVVFGVPGDRARGEHAHRRCHQFLIALSGSLQVVLNDGQNSREVLLKHPSYGLHMPPLIWGVQYRFTQGGMLGVYASEPYDAAEYIRSYAEFRQLVGVRTE